MKPGGCDTTDQMIGDWEKKTKGLLEEYGAGEDGSAQAAIKYRDDTPGQENAHIPLTRTFSTIKRVMRDKYKRKRKLI